jgi:hypothetical protein
MFMTVAPKVDDIQVRLTHAHDYPPLRHIIVAG